jgi:hypothetical protein
MEPTRSVSHAFFVVTASFHEIGTTSMLGMIERLYEEEWNKKPLT